MMDVLFTAAPLLPAPWLLALLPRWGWSVVLLALLAVVLRRLRVAPAVRVVLLLGLLGWVWLPGPVSPAHWLGLAFQSPSGVTQLLCAALLWRSLGSRAPANGRVLVNSAARKITWRLAVLGVLLGWALLLDTFALLPVQLYALGYTPAAVVLALLLCVAVWPRRVAQPIHFVHVLLPTTMCLFIALRLPSGNLWDALLDPLLWLGLHGVVLRALRS